MDEKRIAKPFEMERLIDEQMMKIFQTDEVERWTDDENFWTGEWLTKIYIWMDEVERINGWRKFLNRWGQMD